MESASIDEPGLKARAGEFLNRWPVAGLAVGVIRHGSLAWFHWHGVADSRAGTPVDQDTVFRIGSITKTMTAIAIMQLQEQGLVDLDAPVGDYLRAYRLIPAKAGFRPATLRHLLTHTAGVRTVRDPSDLLRPALGWACGPGARSPRSPSITEVACTSMSSRAASGPAPTTDSPRSARLSRTSAGCRSAATSASACSARSGPGVLTDPQPRRLGGVEVAIRHGHLTIRGQIPLPAVRRGLRLHPDGGDPDAFRINLPGFGSGTSPVVFSRDPSGRVTAVHLGVQPLSFRKRPGALNPRPRVAGALAAGAVALAAAHRYRTHRAVAIKDRRT